MSPEPLDPEKYHRLDLLNKKIRFYLMLAFTLIFIITPVALLAYYNFAINRPAQQYQITNIEITKGQGVSEIAQNLKSAQTINSEFLFKIYVVLNKKQQNLQAGVYKIPAGTSIAQLTRILQHGTNDKSVTFLEGWRVEEFAYKASTEFENIDYAKFIGLAKEYEGMLFPDTYVFSVNIQEEDMLTVLQANFETKTKDLLTQENLDKTGLTTQQVLVFASIVEREVRKDEDLPIVAGILIKRWQEGMKIDADATTQYTIAAQRYGCSQAQPTQQCPNAEEIGEINWWPNDLTIEELILQNPYNTRAVVNLPPTPITNPGLKAIEAVINYKKTDYYYYLNDALGTTHYAKNLNEHNANIVKYLQF